jgi:DNA-binding response OmpR family regulator
MKVLWADDQVEIAKTFAYILRSIGADVDFASNGEDALQKVASERYDILLVDLAMPPGRWGGLWLLEQLKLLPNPPAVIVVSGEGSQTETIQALRLGATDYVTKEKLAEELPHQVHAALEARSKSLCDVGAMVASGESAQIEFKSTLRFNLHAKRSDSNIELAALKSITGFLNANGGTLLLGVSDQGEVLGIDLDQFGSSDKFQLHFWNLVREFIGAEFSEFLDTVIVPVENKSVFAVSCKPSNRPVFVKWKASGESRHQDLFFVRAGPQTEQLGTRQALAYIQDHFRNAGH